ncbi:MAG: hypothetical protein ACM3RP_02385 [Chitinophagales bacterium]
MQRPAISPGLRWCLILGIIALAAPAALAAYRAHGNARDVDAFLNAYPQAKGSSLDDCFLCHPGGKVDGKAKGSCDFCHATYGLKEPHGPLPLNAFARDYLAAGRSPAALARIATLDSDGDGCANAAEIAALTNPGEAADHPGLTQPPAVVLTPKEVRALLATRQFMPRFLWATARGPLVRSRLYDRSPVRPTHRPRRKSAGRWIKAISQKKTR